MADNFNASEHMDEVEKKKDELLEKIKDAYKKLGIYGSESGSADENASDGYEAGASRELIEELKTLEELYRYEQAGIEPAGGVALPETLGEKPLEYTPMTDAEISDAARKELNAKYEELENAAAEKYGEAKSEIKDEIAKNQLKEQTELGSLAEKAESEQKSLTENMVVQGLVNSTIFDIGSESIRKKYSTEHEKISAEYDLKYNSLHNELAARQIEYENALAEYNLSYAAELYSEVKRLHAEEEKRLKEINEYNLNLAKREEEYRVKRQQLLEDMYLSRSEAILSAAKAEQEYERQYGVSYEKQTEYVRRYETAKNFYSRYDADQAGAMMEESEGYLRLLLGDEQFTALMRWNYTERGQ